MRTRAFIFNTLLADKATDDRLRGYETWISSRNLSNEAPDASVATLVEAVRKRNDIPQRWYALKARLLGLDRIADYDRMASVAESEEEIGWDEARTIVLDAYSSFSPDMASDRRPLLRRAVDRRPAPTRQARRRLLLVHRAVGASLRVPQLDGPAA